MLDGAEVEINSPGEALKFRIAMITEDRKASGLFLSQSVRKNISLTSLSSLSRWSFINERKEKSLAQRMIERFHIKVRTPGPTSPAAKRGQSAKGAVCPFIDDLAPDPDL